VGVATNDEKKKNVFPKTMSSNGENASTADVKIFTLNCWGLRFVSSRRVERMEALGRYLASSDYDVVTLQEVWMGEDFERIRNAVAGVLPYSHFFDNGVIGSGTCVFSRAQINDATFHEFGANGYPHEVSISRIQLTLHVFTASLLTTARIDPTSIPVAVVARRLVRRQGSGSLPDDPLWLRRARLHLALPRGV